MHRNYSIVAIVVTISLVAIGTAAFTTYTLYETSFAEQRARLVELAKSQARIMEVMASFHARHMSVHELSAKLEIVQSLTVGQIRKSHANFEGFGKTGEFTLAQRRGDEIVFQLRHRHFDLDKPNPVPFTSERAEPMRRALNGKAGTLVGLDYRGVQVLAAHEPIAVLNMGLVAKIDIAEIRIPFIKAGGFSLLAALAIIFLATFLVRRIMSPMIVELRQNEARFRAAFENVATGNIVIDEDGIIEVFNAEAEKIFGYSSQEVVGQNVGILMPEADRNVHDNRIQNYLKTGNAKIIGIGREVEGVRKNGDVFPMQLGIGKMKVDGRVSFIGSIADLTELKALEQQLTQSQRMEAVGQLTGGIAHDFNNLLHVMIGNAEMLKIDGREETMMHRNVDAIVRAIDRASSLTNRLLAFSRQQTLSPVATNVTELITTLEDMLRRALGETIDLKFAHTPDLWAALIDPHQFENALVNLALNARDSMPDGGALTVETATVTLDETYTAQHADVLPGEYVKVTVSDTGTGIPGEILDKVFEPFFTTKEVGKGSGLGLSMVYGFVKQSNGHITIDSEEGHGTTINMYLPRSEEAVTQEKIEEDTQKFARGSERILIVEDDELVREIPVSMLRDRGYEVIEAGNGKDAIKCLESGKPFDLLFTDMVLPGGMNGVEIAEQAIRLQPNIKILYTTGYADKSVAFNGKLDPVATLINKPYRRAKLLEKIQSILDTDRA